MKQLFAIGLLALLLNSCGAQAAPTVDPVQVQASAAAAAATMLAGTQAAIPTNPAATDTPQSSPTPLPSPTLEALPTAVSLPAMPTAVPQSGQGGCVHPLAVGDAGPTHDTLIKNESDATINLSLNLYKPNAFGECGSISYANLTKNASVMAHLPAGYWFAYAWATANGKSFHSSGSFFVQPAQFDKLEVCVRSQNIVYSPAC